MRETEIGLEKKLIFFCCVNSPAAKTDFLRHTFVRHSPYQEVEKMVLHNQFSPL